MPKHKLVAYTDGACSGNPGPGGWGVLLQAFSDDRVVKERELSNGEKLTTNNKMELRAAIAALEILDRTSEITIITDSKYVMNGIQTWLAGWKKNNWKTASKKPVKNEELWKHLDLLCEQHEVNWKWVKGHTGDMGNERVDKLARSAMEPFKED
jgi:ribonuclease HI